MLAQRIAVSQMVASNMPPSQVRPNTTTGGIFMA
jgi:hypothetical protein